MKSTQSQREKSWQQRAKRHIALKRAAVGLTLDFSRETIEARRQWNIFKL